MTDYCRFLAKKTIPSEHFHAPRGTYCGQSGTPVPTVKEETAIYAQTASI